MKVKSLLLSAAMLTTSASMMAFDWNGYESINPDPATTVEYFYEFNSVIINYGANEVSVDASAGMPYLTRTESNAVTYAESAQLWQMALEYMGQYAIQINFPDLTEYGDYTLTVPAGIMTAGGESNPEMTFKYKVVDPNAPLDLPPLELISVDPAQGSALESPGASEGRTYTINTNLNKEIAYLEASWYDVTDPDNIIYIAETSSQHLDDNGEIPDTPLEFMKISSGGDKMYIGHQYEMRVKCYNSYGYNKKSVGELIITYTGACEEYIYSDIQLISIAPNPNDYIIEAPEEGKFYVKFSGPVTIDETLSNMPIDIVTSSPYESITPNEDNTEFTFVIPESVLNQTTVVNCNVVAHDAEGRAVLPCEEYAYMTNGSEEKAGVMISYQSGVANKPLTVSPESGTYSELTRFRLSCSINGTDYEIMPSWMDYPYITKGRERVYTFNLENDIETDPEAGYFDPIYWMDLVLPEAITEPGNYALIIPSNSFALSNGGYDQYNSKSMVISYTIEGGEVPEVVYDLEGTITPAPGSDVESISEFKISYPEDVYIVGYDVYLLDEQGNEVAKAEKIEFDPNDWDNCHDVFITFTPAVTEDGEYTLYIPQGTIGDETYGMENGVTGRANPDIRAQYSIKAVGVDTIVAEGVTGDVYDITGKLVVRDASATQINGLDKGIYIINGKKVVVK